MSIHIKEATTADISLLSDLIQNSFRDVALRFNLNIKNAPTHPSNCTDDWIKSDFENGKKYFILKKEKVHCGCVAIERANENVFYLERLGVLPEYRNNGFGTLLVEHAKKKTIENDASRIEIGIIGENIELKEWYLKRGFIFREN
ncbi:MAG: GNAT family N-acetyltransferase, partial [Promethearchaeota archaeon]